MATTMRISPLLPWDRVPEEESRFRRLLLIVLAIVLVLGTVITLIKLPPAPRVIRPDVPDRLVKLVVEKKQLPPPPPVELPKQEEKKPEETKAPEPEQPKPEEKRPDKPVKTAKEVAKQHMAVFDALADLRAEAAPAAKAGKPLTDATAAGSAPSLSNERSLISDRAKAGSGGIVTAKASVDRGSGNGIAATGSSQVVSTIATEAAVTATAGEKTGSGGGSRRSDENIQRGFDDAKASIFALYNRALRSNPDLKGKVVFRLEIQPDGRVSSAEIVSSELNDPELERKLLAKVRQIDFGSAGSVWKDTYRMDFFPT